MQLAPLRSQGIPGRRSPRELWLWVTQSHTQGDTFTVLLPPYEDVEVMRRRLSLGSVSPEWVLFTIFLHILPKKFEFSELLFLAGAWSIT